MKFRSAVTLTLSLALLTSITACSIDNSDGSDLVYTWNCESPEQKPSEIVLTCADAGMYVDQITWSSWAVDGALGKGTYNVNECDPNCAEGTMVAVPVYVELSSLTKYQGKYYLRKMLITSTTGENLPQTGAPTYEWDVMEFAEMENS